MTILEADYYYQQDCRTNSKGGRTGHYATSEGAPDYTLSTYATSEGAPDYTLGT